MAQKTIDFEKDILEPIDTLKQGLSAESDARKKDVQKLDNNKITKFYTSSQGQKVLNDSDDGKIQDLMIYGKSEQKQYTGKNLLNYEKWKTVGASNGTAVYENNGVTITATAYDAFTGVAPFQEKAKILVTPGKTYILSWEEETNVQGIIYIFPNGGTDNMKHMDNKTEKALIYTVPEGITFVTFRFGVTKAGNTISYKNIMFEEGSERTDYEPYTGGKPSPSPEFPQEIKAVVNPTIKTHGKNLLNATMRNKTQYGLTCVNNGDGTYTFNGKATDTVDFYIYGNYDNVIRIPLDGRKTYFVKKSGNSNVLLTAGVRNGYVATAGSENAHIVNKTGISFLACRILNGTVLNNFTIYPQIEEGSDSTDFQLYQETQATLPYDLNAIPVSSGGNVTIDGQQYIADYVDVERGKLVRMCKEIDFTTVTPTSYALNPKSISEECQFEYKKLGIKQLDAHAIYSRGAGYIDHLHYNAGWTWDVDRIGIFGHGQGENERQMSIRVPLNTGRNTKEYFKSIGGCKGIFQIETPEEIDLTQDQIESFKVLSTYYPKTYINAESEQLEAYTMFSYPVSMEKGWEYVKQQIGDTRKYVYDMETKLSDAEYDTAMAYVNSEYAVALTELGM